MPPFTESYPCLTTILPPSYPHQDYQQTSCLQCPEGFYCPNATTKVPCPDGRFCPAGSTEPLQCSSLYDADNSVRVTSRVVFFFSLFYLFFFSSLFFSLLISFSSRDGICL